MAKNKRMEEKIRILGVAAKLFHDKSFLSVSIDEIASTLKINKAMIYYYFKSKGFLLYEIMFSSVDEAIRKGELIIVSSASPTEKLRLLSESHIKAETNRSSLAGVAQFELKNLPRRLMRSYGDKRDKYEQLFRNVLQEGMAKGQFRKDDINMTGRLILGLLNSVATWYSENGALSPEEISEVVSKFVANALLPRKQRL